MAGVGFAPQSPISRFVRFPLFWVVRQPKTLWMAFIAPEMACPCPRCFRVPGVVTSLLGAVARNAVAGLFDQKREEEEEAGHRSDSSMGIRNIFPHLPHQRSRIREPTTHPV